ncbi:hypothetical protein K438DRAFT_1943661 [Mycena galopus ATCC 62051]|nr:hypothetical protein K438DRAFT_1943661 [Mycena galopus ATCC 62051]
MVGEKKPRGQPKATFIARGRAAAKKALTSLLHGTPPLPPRDTMLPEKIVGCGVILDRDEARQAHLAEEDYGVPSQREDGREAPVWLQILDAERERKGYVLLDTIHTEDMPKWFHDQKNDYQPKDHTESQIVKQIWFGHPGDSPHNIRARKLVIRWDKTAPAESRIRAMAIAGARPVLRWNYVCAGVHDRPPIYTTQELAALEEEEGENCGSGSESAKDSNTSNIESDGSEATGVHRHQWRKCGEEVTLQLEVTADDLAIVKIWQKGKHDNASDRQIGYLMFSRFLRLQIMDRFRRFRAKVMAVQRDLVDQFLLPSSSGPAEPLLHHRIPNGKQIQEMLSASKQRTRLIVNPFLATWLMVKRNTRDMYNYTPHDFDRPDSESRFTVGITSDFSLDSTILNTAVPNGTIFVDSAHQLRNENCAATTAICTADNGNHVMPAIKAYPNLGAYLISANIKATTIKQFFLETVHKIEARAENVAADIKQHGFNFTNINIDKSRSELNRILAPLRELKIENPCIRLCQFHVILAILRFDFDNGRQGLGFAIPTSIKAEILVLFRKLQRCCSRESWEETKHMFHAGLTELLGDSDPEFMTEQAASEQVAAAPDDEKGHTTPAAPSQCRHRAPPPKTKKAKADGRTCLEVVQAYFDDNWFIEPWIPMFTDIGLPSGQSCDDTWNTNNWVESGFKQFNTVFLDNKHNKRRTDSENVIAARLLQVNGPGLEWKAQETKTEKPSMKRREKGTGNGKNRKKSQASKLPGDDTIEGELNNVLNKLRHWEETEEEKDLDIEAKFGGKSQVQTSAGRPANAQPLRPWRCRKLAYASPGTYGYSPRFIKKRGPAKRVRLTHNSLLPAMNCKELTWRAARRRRTLANLFTVNASKALSGPIPPAGNGDLDEEDLSLNSTDPGQFKKHDYMLCMDEMLLFVEILNRSVTAINRGFLFLSGGPQIGFAERLRSLREFGIEPILELVATRKNTQVNHIVYFELRGGHWTTFHHDLTGNPPSFSWLNSLGSRQPFPQDDLVNSVVLNLHGTVRGEFVKELVVPMYISFLGDEFDVPASLVHNLFTQFQPHVDLGELPPETIFSLCPVSYERVVGPDPTPPVLPSLRLLLPSSLVVLNDNFNELLSQEDPEYAWIITSTLGVTARELPVIACHLKMLIGGQDLAARSESRATLPFLFTNSIFGKDLVAAKRNAQGMPPPERSNVKRFGSCQTESWFKKDKINIFDKDRLIIPLFWPAMKPWLVAAVFFSSNSIRIFDSLPSAHRACAVMQHVRDMLEWEHRQHFDNQSLPEAWTKADAAEVEFIAAVSQQDNAVDCGIYTVAFSQAIAQNVDPSAVALTNDSVAQSWIEVANRLNRAIRAHRKNAAALGIPLTEPSGETGNPPPPPRRNRAIPTDPIGHIAFFPVGDFFFPTETVESTSGGDFRLEWQCQLLFMDDGDKPTGEFTCTRETWLEAVSRLCDVDQLVPVMWPVALLNSGRKNFASYVFDSDHTLDIALEEHADQPVRQLSGLPDEEDLVFSKIKDEFLHDRPPGAAPSAFVVPFECNIFPSFLLLQVLEHESRVFHLTRRIMDAVAGMVTNEHPLRQMAEGIGYASLCVKYVSHLTSTSMELAY